jgi:epoxide hydrolase-like predicted phosphatase
MEVRAVITDFGGVLYNPPDLSWLRRWQTILGLKNDDLVNQMFDPGTGLDLMQKVFTGEIHEAEVWNRAAARWRTSPALIRWLQKRGFSRKRFNEPMAAFIQSLRPAYMTAILSNAGDQGRQTFCMAYQLEKLVDTVIISAEEGLAKPDERIYYLALERLGVAVQEALFIDDLGVNVEAARRVGIKSVHFHETHQAVGEIKAILVA